MCEGKSFDVHFTCSHTTATDRKGVTSNNRKSGGRKTTFYPRRHGSSEFEYTEWYKKAANKVVVITESKSNVD